MKKTIIPARTCRLQICGSIFTPKNGKGAYCCDAHRLVDNRIRREKRDLLFNTMLKEFKNNYHILLLYQIGTILTVKELKKIGFDFDFMPQSDEDNIFWFGKIGMSLTENLNYKLILRNNASK